MVVCECDRGRGRAKCGRSGRATWGRLLGAPGDGTQATALSPEVLYCYTTIITPLTTATVITTTTTTTTATTTTIITTVIQKATTFTTTPATGSILRFNCSTIRPFLFSSSSQTRYMEIDPKTMDDRWIVWCCWNYNSWRSLVNFFRCHI